MAFAASARGGSLMHNAPKLAAYGKIKHRASARLFINNILLFLGYGNLLVLNHKVLAADYCLLPWSEVAIPWATIYSTSVCSSM